MVVATDSGTVEVEEAVEIVSILGNSGGKMVGMRRYYLAEVEGRALVHSFIGKMNALVSCKVIHL